MGLLEAAPTESTPSRPTPDGASAGRVVNCTESKDSDALLLLLAVWQRAPCTQVLEYLVALHGGLGPEAQHALVALLEAQPAAAALPRLGGWVQRLLRQAVVLAERQGHTVEDPLADTYARLLLAPPAASHWGFKTFYHTSHPSEGQARRLATAAAALLPQRLAATAASREGITAAGGGVAEVAAAALVAAQTTTGGGVAGPLGRPSGERVTEGDDGTGAPERGSSPGSSAAGCDGGCDAGLVTLLASDNLFEGSTGCHVWEAALVLGELLLSRPEVVAGRRCLELGCGAGLAGVCAVRAGAAQLLLTDGDALSLAACCHNMRVNGVAARWLPHAPGDPAASGAEGVACVQLDWRDLGTAVALQPDIVVGSDLMYAPELVPLLLRLLRCLLSQPQPPPPPPLAGDEAAASDDEAQPPAAAPAAPAAGHTSRQPVAIIATTLRHESTMRLFQDSAAGMGLRVEALRAAEWAAPVRFQQVLSERQRGSVLLHRITARV